MIAGIVASQGRVSAREIGDFWEGGYYAGIITYPDERSFHIILSDKADHGAGVAWKDENTDTPGTDDTFDGVANMASMDPLTHPAAAYCLNYTGGGHSDWYLPAVEELYFISAALKDIFPFSSGDQSFGTIDFTSSTQQSSSRFWEVRMSTGSGSARYKTSGADVVAPVRRVPV